MRPLHCLVLASVIALSLVATSGWDLAIGQLGVAVTICWLFVIVFLSKVRGWRGSLMTIAGLVAVALIGITGVPSRTRLEFSKRSIEDAGRAVLRGGEPKWAGLYGVSSSWVSPQGCAILVTHSVVIDDEGFAYCPGDADSQGRHHLFSDVYEYTS